MATRCNCDASCGENRYHDVGSSGCRFDSEEAYESYWRNRRSTGVDGTKKVLEEMRMGSAWDNYEPPSYDEPKREQPYVGSMKRPWGSWHVLDVDQGYKVKRLEILPDQSISLQYHNHRDEYWTLVQGQARVILGGKIHNLKKGDSFLVLKGELHKVTNTHLTETLIAIEVQVGEICSEDDIVRC